MIDAILYIIIGVAALMLLNFFLKAFLLGFIITMMIKKTEVELKRDQQKREME